MFSFDRMPGGLQALLFAVAKRLAGSDARIGFSQEGEDGILSRLFEGTAAGFYVDVGAHHPRRFSNTALLYDKGWRGINIEPNPVMVDLLRKQRGRDVTVEAAVGEHDGELQYYEFNDPALNTLEPETAMKVERSGTYRLLRQRSVVVSRLQKILDEHQVSAIDLLNVDVEGRDLQVLKSLDWRINRPKVVLAESVMQTARQALEGEIAVYLSDQGYTLIAKTINSLMFVASAELSAFGFVQSPY